MCEGIDLLQIASGKLFSQSPGQRNELRGVLHTNLCLFGGEPIETAAGRLLPTNSLSLHHGQLVFEFTELIEQPPAPGVIASHGIDPYLHDFAAVVSLALNVTCTLDPEATSRLISNRNSTVVRSPQCAIIPRMFDNQVFCQDDDAIQLVEFVQNLIGLKRKSFLAAMRAIRTYVVGLHRLADDLQIAYVLLVASIESLAQQFDDFQPEWADYDEGKRLSIDRALANSDTVTIKEVRDALLKNEHISLARRFRDFTIEHIQGSYFREDAVGVDRPASRADLEGALREAYRLRSQYIHSLKELPSLMTMGANPGEIVQVGGVTLLTIQGMARLARHVIIEFIRRQPKVEKEVYDYSKERVGIVSMPLAAQYWVGKPENVTHLSGPRLLVGFMQQITSYFIEGESAVITDLRPMLKEVERLLPSISKSQRRPFLALYFLFNKLVLSNEQMAKLKTIERHYLQEIVEPSIESILVHLVLKILPEWPLREHRRIYELYFEQRERKSGLRVPRALEAGLSLQLAERYRLADDVESARELVKSAVENHPGHESLRNLEQGLNPAMVIDWCKVILPVESILNTNERQ